MVTPVFPEVKTEILYLSEFRLTSGLAVAKLVAGLSSQIPGFGAGSVHVKSVVNAAEL
jgi:hypothetical protein